MVTNIQGLAGSAYQPTVAGVGSPVVHSQANGPNVNSGQAEKVTISLGVGIHLSQDQSIAAGRLINQADQTLSRQQAVLSGMHDQLQGILKQFPPYGAEDPQRIAYLKSFSGLKKEIESLQFPRDSQAEQGLPKGVVLPSQSSVGKGIPDLSGASVSDQQVAQAAGQIQTALAQVTRQREVLAQSVQAALGGSGYSELAQKLA